MTDKDNGGPAFPVHGGRHADDDPRNRTLGGGMTLRDWFAGQALNGWLSSWPDGTKVISGESEALVAQSAYAFADAMLEARK